MVSAVSAPIATTKTSIFYINDEHSQIANIERLKSASDEFDSFTMSDKTDKLKFSSGDFALGSDKNLNKLAVQAQNSMGIMATSGGNHEFDLLKEDVAEVLNGSNYKILGLNVDIPETSDVNKELKKDIQKSYIQEQNGTKYGIIGILPFDFKFHVTSPDEYKDFNILPIEKTIVLLQEEVDNLQKQGVNKIILLSHAGYNSDVAIARSVEGIDVILGGHTHNLIKGIEEGKNLFYSKKTGAPTIITQAGKDGNYFGVLNLEFDQNGVITKAQNNVNKTEDYPKSTVMKNLTDNIMGKAPIVGSASYSQKYFNDLISENPSADLITDAMRIEMKADIALLNSANMRGNFEQGDITTRDISTASPFKNKMFLCKVTEKELVDAIKTAARSLTHPDNMPGILQVSGLKYKINKSGKLLELRFVDRDGRETSIDVNNPNLFKTYTVAMDSYLGNGGNDLTTLDKAKEAQKFDFGKEELTATYLKKQQNPIEIKSDGRIQVVN